MAVGETFNQLVNQALVIAMQARHQAQMRQAAGGDPAAAEEGRDLSLAITHLEDGRTRYNSSRYRLANAYDVRDPDDPANGLFLGGEHGTGQSPR